MAGTEAPTIDFSSTEGVQPSGAATNEKPTIDFASLENAPHDPAPPAPAGKLSGVVANIGAGLNRGIADTLGAPVDATTWALNKGAHGVNALAGKPIIPDIENPVGGSESIKKAMGLVGANPDNVVATTPTQKFVGDLGQGVGSMVIPGLGAEGAIGSGIAEGRPLLSKGLEAVRGSAEQPSAAMQTLKNIAGNTAAGAASAAGSNVAQSVSPDWLKPYAGVAGGVVGGAGTAIFHHALGTLRAAPIETQAADKFQSGLSDPAGVRSSLATAPERTLEGGPTYTPGQMSNDSGLLQMQNWDQNQRPEVYKDKAAAQNATQVNALNDVQPTGNPATVGQHITDQLRKIDAAYGAVQDAALQHAQTTLDAIGGGESPEAYGAVARQAITNNYSPKLAAIDGQIGAQGQAASAALAAAPGQRFAGSDTPTATQQYGQQLRDFVQQGRDARAAEENRLWSAVRQNGDVQFDQRPAVESVQQATGMIQPAGGDRLTPDEEHLYGLIGQWTQPQPFDVMKAMRSNIGDAANVAFRGGNAQAGRRLLTVRNGLDGSIENAVDARAAAEQAAVQQGVLHPENTVGASLARDANQWMANSRSGQRPQAAVAGAGRNVADATAAGTDAISGAPGAEVQASAGRDVSDNVPGVAPEPGQIAEQYAAARAATRETHQIFDDTPAGAAIERGPYGGPEALPASQVAAKFFNAGRHAPEDVANFYAATASAPEARAALADYAAFSLRQAAQNPDGTLNVGAYRRWLAKHQEALKAIPEATLHFGSAVRAQNAIEALGALRDNVTKQFTAALGPSDSTVMSKYWRPGAEGTDAVRSFKVQSGNAPQAQQSLVEHAAATLRQTAVGLDGQISPAKYQAWAKRYAPALAELPPEVGQRFSTASKAQETLDEAAANRAEAVAGYQKSAAGAVMRADDPVAAVGQALRGNAGPENMRFLAHTVRGDPDAAAGLRRATLEWLTSKAAPQDISGKEAADTATNWVRNQTFRNTLSANRQALQQVFSFQQMAKLDAIARDLQITDRSVSGSKPPIGPGTARDVAAAGRYGSIAQRAGTLLQAVAAGTARVGSIVAGHHFGGVEGSMVGSAAVDALGAARRVASTMTISQKSAEMTRLIQAAIEDPEAARLLLTKTTPANAPTLASRLSARIAQSALTYSPLTQGSRRSP